VSLMALTERVHSDGAIPPGRKCFLLMEVEWRDEEPYMMPTKKGKKRNEGTGVKRPTTPKRPIPNMPQTPSRKKFESD